MKTFLTEKNSIPEGATHYWNETLEDYFAWWDDANKLMLTPDGNGEWESVYDKSGNEPTPIPQTNIETPEEKEALDTMTGISREHLMSMINQQSEIIKELSEKLNTSESPNGSVWGGAGLPPVGVECWFNFKSRTPEKCTVKYIGDKICVYDDESGEEYSILLSSVEFSRIETEAERVERERLEWIEKWASKIKHIGTMTYKDILGEMHDSLK